MAKAILEFNLPDDSHEFNAATKAIDFWLILMDIKDSYRTKLKYGNYTEDQQKLLEELQDEFYMMFENHGITTNFVE